MSTYTPTQRTKARRLKKRAVYDKAGVHEILDEGFVCHLGFTVDAQPYVIPTLYARSGDLLYLHGSQASRSQTPRNLPHAENAAHRQTEGFGPAAGGRSCGKAAKTRPLTLVRE